MGSRLLHFFEKNMELFLHPLIINILHKYKIFFHYNISINALRLGPVPLKHSCDFTLGITLHSSQTSLITQPMRIKRNPDNNRHHLLPTFRRGNSGESGYYPAGSLGGGRV